MHKKDAGICGIGGRTGNGARRLRISSLQQRRRIGRDDAGLTGIGSMEITIDTDEVDRSIRCGKVHNRSLTRQSEGSVNLSGRSRKPE
ncbi:hypothetical protein [Acidiphilium sp.]|uniref:hypothetical protein n=1 Tax=Acidiphilium sp. TaxID=527 RepID=UPI002C11E656|nr:hypothetical protein [Acidiphilium sp.]HQT60112.1 hypothetical protein [Acidiphilium sp.]